MENVSTYDMLDDTILILSFELNSLVCKKYKTKLLALKKKHLFFTNIFSTVGFFHKNIIFQG